MKCNKCNEVLGEKEKEVVQCTGPCHGNFHGACGSLPRNWHLSSMQNYIRGSFICDSCRNSINKFRDLVAKQESLEQMLSERFDALDSCIKKLDNKIALNHHAVSDWIDQSSSVSSKEIVENMRDLSKRIDEIVESVARSAPNLEPLESDIRDLHRIVMSQNDKSIRHEIDLLEERQHETSLKIIENALSSDNEISQDHPNNDGWITLKSGRRVWRKHWSAMDLQVMDINNSGFKYSDVNKPQSKPRSKPQKRKTAKKKSKGTKGPLKEQSKNPIDIEQLDVILRNLCINSNLRSNPQRSQSFNRPERAQKPQKEQEDFTAYIPQAVHRNMANYNSKYNNFVNGGVYQGGQSAGLMTPQRLVHNNVPFQHSAAATSIDPTAKLTKIEEELRTLRSFFNNQHTNHLERNHEAYNRFSHQFDARS